jgi:hypothetical protein
MNWAPVIDALVQSIVTSIESAEERDMRAAMDILAIIVNTSSENKIRAQQALERIKLEEFLSGQK